MAQKKLDVSAFNQQARQAKLRAAQAKAPKEMELWDKWNKGGRKTQDLVPLMKSMENLVQREARKYNKGYGGALVQGANELEARKLMLRGLKTYDPNRGTKLTTHVHNQFQRMTEVAAKRRNFGAMSRKDFQTFQQFNNAVNELKEERGVVDPTVAQIAQRLQWPIGRTARVQQSVRRELFTGITPGQDDDVGGPPSQMRSIMSLMPLKNEKEKAVFRGLRLHKNPEQEPKSPLVMKRLAQTLKMPLSRVYKIRDTLKNRVQNVIDRI